MRPEFDFPSIVPRFQLQGEFVRAAPYGEGHINDTYLVDLRAADGAPRSVILQRINHAVFRNPAELMANMARVVTHLQCKIVAAGGDPKRETLTLIPTQEGEVFHRTERGDYWRACVYIENASTYQIPQSLQQVFNVAFAYGTFSRMLADFPAAPLYDTIPDFHNTPMRFKALVGAIERDAYNRARNVRPEIGFALQRADDTRALVDLIEQGDLPLSVTHNDTKLNNVLIDDQTGRGLCVIDLDTVMRGTALYDFGDAIRSIANTAAEDERDLARVHFSLEVFQHYTQGYLEAVGDSLTPAEIDHLPFSAHLMTLECGMRFLTDHLEGDTYFRTTRAGQNLDRCRTQFKLVQEMKGLTIEMDRIVREA